MSEDRSSPRGRRINKVSGSSTDGENRTSTITYELEGTDAEPLSPSKVFRLVERQDPRRFSAVRALLAAGALMVAVLAATVFLLTARQEVLNNPAAALSLVLVAATVVLILVMCTLTIVFRRLRIQDKSQPMGLPRGSVRAVIALLLITLFFIVAIFLFSSTQNRADPDQTRALNGVSADRVADIPTEEIKDMTDRVVDGTTVYDLVLFLPSASTTTSDDIAKQLVTTVGTLVTAVAAFYFGANTVAGAAAKNNGLQVPPIVPPAGPEVLKPAGNGTDPAEQAAAKAEAEQAAADQAAADQAAADQAAVDEAVAEEQAAAESDADATAVSGDVVTDASPPDEPAEPPDAASKSVG